MAALDRRSAASAPGYSIQSNHHTVFYCRRGMQLSPTGSVLFDHGGVAAAVVFGRTSQPCSASPLPDLSARLESCPCFNPFVGTSQPRDNDRYHLIDRRSGWIGSSERRPFIYSHQHRCRNYFAPLLRARVQKSVRSIGLAFFGMIVASFIAWLMASVFISRKIEHRAALIAPEGYQLFIPKFRHCRNYVPIGDYSSFWLLQYAISFGSPDPGSAAYGPQPYHRCSFLRVLFPQTVRTATIGHFGSRIS